MFVFYCVFAAVLSLSTLKVFSWFVKLLLLTSKTENHHVTDTIQSLSQDPTGKVLILAKDPSVKHHFLDSTHRVARS